MERREQLERGKMREKETAQWSTSMGVAVAVDT